VTDIVTASKDKPEPGSDKPPRPATGHQNRVCDTLVTTHRDNLRDSRLAVAH